jgi:ankyrin repeat protein
MAQIHDAAASGDLGMVKILVDQGSDVNASTSWFFGRTPLRLAVEKGHAKVAALLLKSGATDNLQPLLEAAVRAGHSEVVTVLLTKRSPANIEEMITAALMHGHPAVVEALVENRGPVFVKEALQCAVIFKQTLLARKLIAMWGNADERTSKGQTLLMVACKNQDVEMARLLPDHGADVNATRERGGTVLESAIVQDNALPSFELIDLLVKHGADVNAKGLLTPLWAAYTIKSRTRQPVFAVSAIEEVS